VARLTLGSIVRGTALPYDSGQGVRLKCRANHVGKAEFCQQESELMSEASERLGVITDSHRVRGNRTLNIVSIAIPFLGTLACITFGILHGFSSFSWLVFGASFALTAIGIGVGLHRYFVHNAFRTRRVLRFILGVLGSSAMQGPIDRWVADHRRHHRFTDQAHDPHSPYWVGEAPIRTKFAGLVHSHIGWMLTGLVSDESKYAADILREPISAWCSRNYWFLCAVSLLLPALAGLIASGIVEAVSCFLLGGCARITLLHNITWAVNSFGHMFGSRVPGSTDQSRDSVVLALLLMGEGLHSYHHMYPNAALNEPWWLDVNGAIICGLEKLGLAHDVVRYRLAGKPA